MNMLHNQNNTYLRAVNIQVLSLQSTRIPHIVGTKFIFIKSYYSPCIVRYELPVSHPHTLSNQFHHLYLSIINFDIITSPSHNPLTPPLYIHTIIWYFLQFLLTSNLIHLPSPSSPFLSLNPTFLHPTILYPPSLNLCSMTLNLSNYPPSSEIIRCWVTPSF